MGVSDKFGFNCNVFGDIVVFIVSGMSEIECSNYLFIDSDLEGFCGLK